MKEERRSIRTAFWNDPIVESLSKDATYLFLALLSLPENNMSGVYEITTKKIRHYTKMSEEEINAAFRELELSGKVRRFDYWVVIRNHIKNQKINGNMAISITKDLCKPPNTVKHWLYYKSESDKLEDWIKNMVFNINAYLEQQRRRLVKAHLGMSSKQNVTDEQMKENESEFPKIEFSISDFLNVTTQSLPFHHEEISNYFNILTLTKELPNSAMKVEDRSMKLEGGSMKYEDRRLKEESNIHSLIAQFNNSFDVQVNLATQNLERTKQLITIYKTHGHEKLLQTIENYLSCSKSQDHWSPGHKSVITFLTGDYLESFFQENDPENNYRISGTKIKKVYGFDDEGE